MTLSRRRDSDRSRSRIERLNEAVQRVLPTQSQFSAVSSALSAVLAVTMLVDYAVGHDHFDRVAVAAWASSYLFLTILPLVLGERYPRWFGLLSVGYLTLWSVYTLVNAVHAHMEINVLLEIPMIAIYLGWFFPAWLGRLALGLHLLAVTLAVLLRPATADLPFSSHLALVYALLIGGLCLETSARMRARADREAWRDPLTGVLNRRGLVRFGELALTRARQTGEAVSLVVVDFDDFKAVNDSGGHAAGDWALRAVSSSWVDGLGPRDIVARTGGDEFVLLIHEEGWHADARVARLREEAAYPWTWGIAQYRPGDTFDELMQRADVELYRWKGPDAG